TGEHAAHLECVAFVITLADGLETDEPGCRSGPVEIRELPQGQGTAVCVARGTGVVHQEGRLYAGADMKVRLSLKRGSPLGHRLSEFRRRFDSATFPTEVAASQESHRPGRTDLAHS